MTWSSLLEALHSALIDEIVERFPDFRPELGMPLKQKSLTSPSPTILSGIACEIQFLDKKGAAFLALDFESIKTLKITEKILWDALLGRAHTEFIRRKIQPRFGNTVSFKKDFVMPEGFPELKQVIWIPIKIGGGGCYLGVGL